MIITVPSINEDTSRLFELETNKIEEINSDISSQHSTDGSDLDIGSPNDFYDNDYDEYSYNPQGQLSTSVSKVQIKLSNLINNHKALLKLHDDIVNSLGAIGRHDGQQKEQASCVRGISVNFCLLLACDS